jgi:hypothetical protein
VDVGVEEEDGERRSGRDEGVVDRELRHRGERRGHGAHREVEAGRERGAREPFAVARRHDAEETEHVGMRQRRRELPAERRRTRRRLAPAAAERRDRGQRERHRNPTKIGRSSSHRPRWLREIAWNAQKTRSTPATQPVRRPCRSRPR